MYYQTEAKLKTIRASAGSGKTFTLIREYLVLLFKGRPEYFRHILAVTFTNKATAEMKARVLLELNLLARGDNSDHKGWLKEQTKLNDSQLRSKAEIILQHILHNYSWFKISTIDSFFQQIIRSFSRELGIWGGYNLELDTTKIQNESVERLVDSITPEGDILSWIIDFMSEQIEDGRSWEIKSKLIDIAKVIQSEVVQLDDSVLTDSVEAIRDYTAKINTAYNRCLSAIKKLGEQGCAIISNNGLTVDDFANKGRGPASYFDRIAKKGPLDKLPDTFFASLDSTDKWVSKSSKKHDEICSVTENELIPLLNKIYELDKEFHTLYAVKQNLFALGLITQIQKETDAICSEKNLFLINNTNPFLFKIIDQNDSPFIYEKVGIYLNHIFIDEFQDTSGLQWRNFKPLISNSLSEGNNCLLVGDVKQSIYRWRNSNWEILGRKLSEEYSANVLRNEVLDTNWRSAKEIIEFNNAFFQHMVKAMDVAMPAAANGLVSFSELYHDVKQVTSSKGEGKEGYTEHTMIEKSIADETEFYYGEWLLDKINNITDLQYNPGDIVILVRSGNEGKLVADYMLSAIQERKFNRNLKVISNESLYLQSSEIIRLIISFLSYLSDDQDILALTNLISEYISIKQQGDAPEICFATANTTSEDLLELLPDNFPQFVDYVREMPLFEIIQHTIQYFNLHNITESKAYLDAFLDLLHESFNDQFTGLSSFLDFWDEEGCLKSISVSEDKDAIRIMTIHKSKGLEFPFVLLPFCDWRIEPKSGTVLWGTTDLHDNNNKTLLPLKYSSLLERSDFAGLFFEERYRSWVDNLNLLYVAYTRTEIGLFTLTRQVKSRTISLSKLLQGSYESLVSEGVITKSENVYSSGSLVEIERQQEKGLEPPEGDFNLKAQPFRFRASNKPAKWDESEILSNHRIKGLFWHSVLERIETMADIPYVLNKLKREGLLGTRIIIDVEKELVKLLTTNAEIEEWFSGKYQVLNEIDIIIPNSRMKRPDRIMLDGKKAIIVDYKTSRENAEFIEQIKSYRHLLIQMGYEKVEGYIWYLNTNRLVEVNE